MDGYGPESFGQFYAQEYDTLHDPGTTDVSVDRIARLAGSGRVLELAVGTGRIALPLAERGIRIEGIEISPEMVAKLRTKPGGAELPVTIGDMEDVGVSGPFDLILLVFNTLFNLTTQRAQVRLFQNVARCLAPGGAFLVEAFVPDPARFRGHQDVRVRNLTLDSVCFDGILHDPVAQTLTMQRLWATGDRTRIVPLYLRYAWPSELDLMAELAGLRLRDRWGGWADEPFTRDSRMHVSVWERPEM
ncbi:MAG: class I SAM-dependent methyltransferase [Pseudomonadota bacterium]